MNPIVNCMWFLWWKHLLGMRDFNQCKIISQQQVKILQKDNVSRAEKSDYLSYFAAEGSGKKGGRGNSDGRVGGGELKKQVCLS